MVVDYTSYLIFFYSSGMVDMFQPTGTPSSSPPSTQLVGQDVFKFLSTYSKKSLPSDFKSRVKTSLKDGQAISVELVLSTRRSMGFEKFVLHWTPLKGEEGEVGWVVLTLGGANG